MRYDVQLEYDKIIDIVASFAVSDDGRSELFKLEPSSNHEEVAELLDMTEAIFELMQKNHSPNISPVSDIAEIAFRAKKGGLLSMGELLKTRTMLNNSRLLTSWYSVKEQPVVTDELFYALYEDPALERKIAEAILSESEMSDDASAELRDIRKRIQRAQNSIRDKLDNLIRSAESKKYLQDAIVTMRGGRFVVPVKAENRASVKGLVHDVSQSGSTYFIEPEAVVEANNRIMELMGEEAREIERILFGFSAMVAEISDSLAISYRAFITIDVLIAKAKYAMTANCSKPKVNSEGYINLKKARHPLIPSDRVVAVDISLGKEYDILVITGPNTGGKTVALKTTGLLTLMSMAGLLIPAAHGSETSVFSAVFADIGDEQSIEQSLSTFSGHITNVAEILNSADKNSLILLDELGAGTDPAEGAALAGAVLNRILALKCKAVATTHYGEIKVYAMQTKRVQNASCEFDVKSLKPTYHLTVGVPGASNALIIAERLGLDMELISDARRSIDVSTRKFEDALREMEQLRDEIAKKEKAAEESMQKAEEVIADALKESERITNEAHKEYENARTRSRQMAADVEAGARKLLDEIKKLENRKVDDRRNVIARAREIARKDSGTLLINVPDDGKDDYSLLRDIEEIRLGQKAFIISLGQTAEVLSLPDKSGNVEIRVGQVKTRVNIEFLKEVPKSEPKEYNKPASAGNISASTERNESNEINLLGLSVDEAIMETELFIDRAMLGHYSTIYLIHGKGTGALRTALQRHLKNLKQVKSFRLGGYGEGESGVTIVELK